MLGENKLRLRQAGRMYRAVIGGAPFGPGSTNFDQTSVWKED